TLSEARNELVNLYYKKEEMELQKENSAYEAPSIKRQAEINYEKAVRA
ncbi:MAG: RND transporter, partial [candidate division Zixibacteria bacterium]|nr:RND transporter [candidate division Zixibacteria bacterium]NIU17253.1 RND transporter [candidate division Zixibacteria bacterium]NIV09376.1 RND transporter [candidate division Zixibacteria bacterium]NIX59652.1 RND transporter [candidate division Zixibacteria bacterium]